MYEPNYDKDKDGINIRYNDADGGIALRDAIDELMKKCGQPTGSPRGPFVRKLLAQLLIGGNGTSIVSQVDFTGLNLPSEEVDSELRGALDEINQKLTALVSHVQSIDDDLYTIAINFLAELADMEPDEAELRIKDALRIRNDPIAE